MHDGFGIHYILEGISRFRRERNAARFYAHPLRGVPGTVDLVEDAILLRRCSAGEDELRLRIPPRKVSKCEVRIAAKHNDAVDMDRHLNQAREAIFKRSYEPMPHG